MGKQIWKPGNMVYPLPAVMVSTADREGNDNIITVAFPSICQNLCRTGHRTSLSLSQVFLS